MIYNVPSSYDTSDNAARFVKECDDSFSLKLSEATKRILEQKDVKVITLSGPTCSGKTTASKRFLSDFEKHSKRVNIISIDDFYYDKDYLVNLSKEKGMDSVDFDSIDTIDISALKSVIDEIFDSKKAYVHCPVFDFVEGKRTSYRTLECTENDIFLFEGIQALYPEIHDLLDDHEYCDVFICPQSTLKIGNVTFLPNELRLLRRLVRDSNFRGASPQFTFEIWQNVRKNEELNIFPYSSICEIKIDSVFPCELSLLKPYLEKILPTIPDDSEYYNASIDILNKIKFIEPLSKDYLSEDSIYREFI